MSIRVGQRIRICDYRITWENGQSSPAWCCAPGVTFEVIQVTQKAPGVLRVVIGNHNANNGKITRGVTGAILVQV